MGAGAQLNRLVFERIEFRRFGDVSRFSERERIFSPLSSANTGEGRWFCVEMPVFNGGSRGLEDHVPHAAFLTFSIRFYHLEARTTLIRTRTESGERAEESLAVWQMELMKRLCHLTGRSVCLRVPEEGTVILRTDCACPSALPFFPGSHSPQCARNADVVAPAHCGISALVE
ncbi:hypothetical protein AOLI_G00027590 [Acnodon oligacanthus]